MNTFVLPEAECDTIIESLLDYQQLVGCGWARPQMLSVERNLFTEELTVIIEKLQGKELGTSGYTTRDTSGDVTTA